MEHWKNTFFFLSDRRYFKIAAFAAFGVCLGAYLMSQFLVSVPEVPAPPVTRDQSVTASTTALTMAAAEPVRLKIDSVGIEADFEAPLGLQPNREIAVPESFSTVGYYEYGPTPGELGPAVVLGHVDSYVGPAVFWKLGQVTPGDEIEIERADGSVAIFRVTSSERHEQAGFPTRKVYSDIDFAGLRLITCSGDYNRETDRYSHNLIVFAELVATSTIARL